MMTSMGGNRARGSWEQTQGQTQSQTQHKQRPQVPSAGHLSQSPACTTTCTRIRRVPGNLVLNVGRFRPLLNRPLRSRSDLRRWFQTTTMQTLKRRSSRWADAFMFEPLEKYEEMCWTDMASKGEISWNMYISYGTVLSAFHLWGRK